MIINEWHNNCIYIYQTKQITHAILKSHYRITTTSPRSLSCPLYTRYTLGILLAVGTLVTCVFSLPTYTHTRCTSVGHVRYVLLPRDSQLSDVTAISP